MRQLLFILLFGICGIFSFSQGVQKLPANSKIIYFGDSQTSFGYSVSTIQNTNNNAVQFQNFGYIAWTNALAPDVYMPKDGMLGVPGETTSQMVNRLSAIAPTGGKIMVVLAGTNDPLYGIGPSTTKVNLRRIYDAGEAAGMKVIAITIMPRFGSNAYDATREANRKAINAWIKSQSDLTVLDVENDVNDPQYFEDGLHNSPMGAYVVGNKVAGEVNKLVDHCLPNSLKVADLGVAANSNPLLTGTGGTLNTASGTVAKNWQLAGNYAGGATIAGSKETDASGKELQVVNISGTYTGSSKKVMFHNYVGGAIALNPGDVAEGVAEMEVAAPLTGIKDIYLFVQGYTADYASTVMLAYSMYPTSNKTNYMPPGKYLLRTPLMTVGPEGAVGQLYTQVFIEFVNTTTTDPISATLKFSSVGIRKLPLLQSPDAGIAPSGTLSLCPDSTVNLNAATGSGYSYQWNQNGNPLAGSTASSYTAKATGSYTVKVSVPGCSLLSEATVINPSTNCPVRNSLQTGAVSSSLCSGQSFALPFTKAGAYQQGNVFTAQISDGKGSFANPTTIGSLSDTTGSTIPVSLPAALAADTGYRIRVVSSSPAVTGTDNGQSITLHAAVKASLAPADTLNRYPNLPQALTASPQDSSFTYQWLQDGQQVGQNSWADTPSTSGSYRVVITTPGGCTDTAKATYVRVVPCGEMIPGVTPTGPSSVTVNVHGGHAPYRYSLDGGSEQADSSFSNLVAGHPYTVVVKDSVNCSAQYGFGLNGLQTGAVPASLCAGQNLAVPFTALGHYEAGNIFRVELSDGKGLFENASVIGSLEDTVGTSIQALIPANLLPDTGYRVRVISSNPVLTAADNGQAIVVHAAPKASINPADTVNSFENLPQKLSALPLDSQYTYQWLKDGEQVGGNSDYTPSASGNYQVVISNAGACADTSNATYVRMVSCENMSLGVTMTGATSVSINVSGGRAPYRYALSGGAEQDSNVFANLSSGGSYTVTVKDSVNCTAQYSFVLNGIQAGIVPLSFCSGQGLTVPFTKGGIYEPGNFFSVQLSDGKGSFESPVVIGTLADTAGTEIAAILPSSIMPDTGYRIRVVSSSPAIEGSDNGQNIAIHAVIKASISPADTVDLYPNLPLALTASPSQEGFTYQWLHDDQKVGDGNASYTATAGGAYRMVITNAGSCADTSKPTFVRVQPCSQFNISVSSADATVFTITVTGGHAPYRYSLDSITYQSSNTFANLMAGRDYTVYVIDSVNCTGRLTFSIQPPKNCNDQQWIGGRSTTTTFSSQNLGTAPGLVVITYELLPLPDQIDVYYNDSTVVTTRNVDDSLGWVWFRYSPLKTGPDKCNIRLQQTTPDQTAWKYTALCPLNNYTPMTNGSDTTSSQVFVSPNFPNAYPANASLVHTFTPSRAGAKLHADFKALLLSETDTLFVYDGADTLSSLLARYTGGYSYAGNPSLVARNPAGQLTFKFVSGSADGKYGWIADVYYGTSINAFSPLAAKMGDTVTISGAGFTGATSVRFGGVAAASFEVVSDTAIRAVVGAGLSGDVEVISTSGTATKAGFSFVPEMQLCPNGSLSLTADLQGTFYQWQVSADSVNFVDIADNAEYSGATTATLQLTNLSSSHYGYQYRCVVDGANGLSYTIRFVATWTGSVSTEWENAGNWHCGVLPDANTDVIIKSGDVILNSNATVRSLTMQPGVNLTLAGNAVLILTH